jgi:streptogramin lyase
VWFGEQSVPGVGHLFSNGTLIEYAWPSATSDSTQGSCEFKTSIWGIAFWNGMVWGTDGDQNALVGVDPASGATRVVNVTGVGTFPYTLTVGPDGALWFTMLAPPPAPAKIGRITTDYAVQVYGVSGFKGDVPVQMQFVNSTRAYFVAINLTSTRGAGGLFSFDPQNLASGIEATPVGGGFSLTSPSSIALSGQTIWVTQHGAASVASYDTTTGLWTTYPTSTENYTLTTLPYFVQTQGGIVWFNEHYGNKIAMLNPTAGELTEYSEASPPVYNGSAIDNDLTIATTREGVWFTSTTSNYIGYVNGSYPDAFSLSVQGQNHLTLGRGQQTTAEFLLNGSWSTGLHVLTSDSENFTSVPSMIEIRPHSVTEAPGLGRQNLLVDVSVGDSVSPGRYTIAVTVTDGLVYRSAYLFVDVTG